MYAFGPLPKYKKSGRIIGTHQKIDRIARRHLKVLIDNDLHFPDITSILHFEGSRGPDGTKLKSAGVDEPWHFVDPSTVTLDDQLIRLIADHSQNLTIALKQDDMIRAAFEAAWMAHAVTDGLTPAHHEPLDEQLESIKSSGKRGNMVLGKVIMTGSGSRRMFIKNNWSYWGAKGLMTTHTLFEAGVATAAKPRMFQTALPSEHSINELRTRGFSAMFIDMINQVAELHMYDEFKRRGWTRELAVLTTRELMPTIIHAVTLAWLEAYERARKIQ